MISRTSNKKICEQIIVAPKKAIQEFNLVYVSEDKLPILRLKKGEAFNYKIKDKVITQKSHLTRIHSLALPPAWRDVRITNLPNGHLQAIGFDAKNRKQYRYHPRWIQLRNQTKFYKIASFGRFLPLIREKIDEDLKQKQWNKSKVVALVIRLMEETHIRIGNERYARENKSYGLSTLRKKHLNIDNKLLRLEFIGKKGKKHNITIRNKKLIRLVGQCEEIPGWELFKYYDSNGEKKVLDSACVNAYLQTITGKSFSAKDFRTWSASLIFFGALKEFGISKNPIEIKKNILAAYDQAAMALGNTKTVCKNYYVHPSLVTAYEDGSLTNFFEKADKNDVEHPYLSNLEMAMLALFEKFQPILS